MRSDTQPLFNNGATVYYQSRKSKIEAWVGGAERRYLVKSYGWVWSVPEKYLSSQRTEFSRSKKSRA